MKKVWEKLLDSNEEIKYEFTISERYRRIGIIIGIILSLYFFVLSTFLGVVFISFIIFYFGWYLEKSNKYAFTNKRILVYQGWIGSHLTSVDYNKITDLVVIEPFLDKLIFKTGYLKINTAGTDSHEIVLRNLAKPYKIKQNLNKIKEENSENYEKK